MINQRNSSDGQLQACDETAFFVLESSAMEAVPGQESHRQYPIDADHRNLNRFPKRTDQDFQKVAANIESLVEIARGMQEEQFSKTRTSSVSGLLYYTSPPFNPSLTNVELL